MCRQYGDEVRALVNRSEKSGADYNEMVARYPLFQPFVAGALGVVVHSRYARDILQPQLPPGLPLLQLNLPAAAPAEPAPRSRQRGAPAFRVLWPRRPQPSPDRIHGGLGPARAPAADQPGPVRQHQQPPPAAAIRRTFRGRCTTFACAAMSAMRELDEALQSCRLRYKLALADDGRGLGQPAALLVGGPADPGKRRGLVRRAARRCWSVKSRWTMRAPTCSPCWKTPSSDPAKYRQIGRRGLGTAARCPLRPGLRPGAGGLRRPAQ